MRLTHGLILGIEVFAAAGRAAALSCFIPTDSAEPTQMGLFFGLAVF